MASHFRPVLRFDSQERWRPLDIDELIAERRPNGEPAHTLCQDGGCRALQGAAGIRGTGASNIDFSGMTSEGPDARSPNLEHCTEPQRPPLQDCDRGRRSVIYYRVTKANSRLYVDYWWYLRYNNFGKYGLAELCHNRVLALRQCFDHEGDWEGVTVTTSARDHDRAAYIGFAQHDGVHRRVASDLPQRGERPVVFVAQGSHASYSKKCPTGCGQLKTLLGVPLPETNTDGAHGWGRNDDAQCTDQEPCLRPLAAQPWKVYPGRWGSRTCRRGRRTCVLSAGPKSPARQQRYQAPWCHSQKGDRKLQCDGTFRG